jgi:SnoaL-like domain
MKKETFDDYIRRFNAEDPTAFDDYIAPHMHMLNGTLEFTGAQGMKDHYARIWGRLKESLDVERFVSDEDTAAIQMHAHFDVLADDPESLFGPVRAGEAFDFHGLIMYQIEDGKFADIKVAYNRFIFTDINGTRTDLGIPH